MKRIIALITVFVFAVALAGMVYADTRSPAEKLAAGRAYLKLLDKKIIRLRKAGKTALVKKMQVDKKTTIARMKAWKAQAEGIVPAPVAPTPPPPPVAVRPAPAPSAGLLGLGLNTGYTVGYVMTGTGLSAIAARGDLILADALGLGPMVGLSEDAVSWKIGLGGASGKGTNSVQQSGVAVFMDGILAIPADLLGGIESYVGGGVNYVLYRSGGKYGAELFYGIKGDIGLGGNSYAEMAYSVIRPSNTSITGIGINVGTGLAL